MSVEWRPTTKYVIGIFLLLAFFTLLYLSRSVLYLLILGALIAFLIKPVIIFFIQRLRFPKGLAIIFAHILAAIVVLLTPLILIPTILNAVNFLLGLDYQILIDDSLQWLETTLFNLRNSGLQILGYRFVLDSVIDPILSSIRDADPVITPNLPSYSLIFDSITSAFSVSYGIAVSLVGTVFSVLVGFFFMFISSIYLSSDAGKLYTAVFSYVPEAYQEELNTLLSRLNAIWRSFLRGQFTLMLIIGIVVWIGGTAIGLPGAFALGVIAGLLEIIPNLGPFIAAIPAVIVALIQGSNVLPVSNFTFAIIIIIFYIIVQGLENYFIVPRVLGEAVKIHPLVVIFGVLVGATVWGILGALLAAPVIASGKQIVSYLLYKIIDEDPFPPDEISTTEPEPISELLKRTQNRLRELVRIKRSSEADREDTSLKSGE
jgi:predicted PurR-regulated permease PerM